MDAQLVFGPVPSRRLGQSLGINDIPPKVCSYSCVYCQVGRTSDLSLERRSFYGADRMVAAVTERVAEARRTGERIDFLTFVPDGEPTLDRDLGVIIAGLAPLGIPVAVITNGSLLWDAEVRHELAGAAWVSVKVDCVEPDAWLRTNRPARGLTLERVLDGIRAFAKEYPGTLVTETLLVAGLNDAPDDLRAVAAFVGELGPSVAYLAAPIRPPAEGWVGPPDAARLEAARAIFAEHVPNVELLFEPGDAGGFGSLGPIARDLAAICAVHPMNEGAVRELLKRREAPEGILEGLVQDGVLERVTHEGRVFYGVPWQRRSGE